MGKNDRYGGHDGVELANLAPPSPSLELSRVDRNPICLRRVIDVGHRGVWGTSPWFDTLDEMLRRRRLTVADGYDHQEVE